MPATIPSPGPAGEECLLCHFFQRKINTSAGICRRFPPPEGSGGNTSGSHRDSFPEVHPSDWCGEFNFAGYGFGTLSTTVETPDGINDTFTASDSGVTTVKIVFVNGDAENKANYTVNGNQVTFVAAAVPQPGDVVQLFG